MVITELSKGDKFKFKVYKVDNVICIYQGCTSQYAKFQYTNQGSVNKQPFIAKLTEEVIKL